MYLNLETMYNQNMGSFKHRRQNRGGPLFSAGSSANGFKYVKFNEVGFIKILHSYIHYTLALGDSKFSDYSSYRLTWCKHILVNKGADDSLTCEMVPTAVL